MNLKDLLGFAPKKDVEELIKLMNSTDWDALDKKYKERYNALGLDKAKTTFKMNLWNSVGVTKWTGRRDNTEHTFKTHIEQVKEERKRVCTIDLYHVMTIDGNIYKRLLQTEYSDQFFKEIHKTYFGTYCTDAAIAYADDPSADISKLSRERPA